MPRYRLRTLLFLLALLPPMVGWAWFNVENGFEFIGWLTLVSIVLTAYWSITSSQQREQISKTQDRYT